MNLRPYQRLAVDHALTWRADAAPASRLLLASPTGTGKSYMELAILDDMPEGLLVTPKMEIVADLLRKISVTPPDTESALADKGQAFGIWTPIRLRNALLAGETAAPKTLLMDEAHHDTAESWQDIHLLCGYPPAIGFTATPYRGTPKGTATFRAEWGEPTWIITYPEAVATGVLAFPLCSVVPLLDDDEIEIVNGELHAKAVNAETMSRIDAIVDLVGKYFGSFIDTPTMLSLPSREAVRVLSDALESRGIPSVAVTGETPQNARQEAFRACVERRAVLLQINVVSEGVDLPIRRLIDCSPTLSPVKFLQQLGRITRPGGLPEYICTNRNLLRHGYLLDGCLPISVIKDAQAAFPVSERSSAVRAIGLEAIGRLKPVNLPLAGGLAGLMYAMSAVANNVRTDYCVIVHPLKADPIWAKKESIRPPGGEYSWGRWSRCDAPSDISGFASLPPSPLSEKQRAWWERSAASKGLDAAAEITKKQFPVLPVLTETRIKL